MTTKTNLAESNFASLAAMMSAYAEEAVRVAWNDHRRRLDLSESSVDLLEQILDGQSAEDLEFQTRCGAATLARCSADALLGMGAFAVSRRRPCRCSTLLIRGSRLYPLMKVYRRLTLGEEEISPPSTRWFRPAWASRSRP